MRALPKAVVISLRTAQKRRRFETEQLEKAGLPFEFFDALEPGDIDAEDLARRSRQWARPLGAGEVACLLSHRCLWERVADSGEPVLILEDDAVLSRDILELLRDLTRLENIDYATLETFTKAKLLSRDAMPLSDGRYAVSELYRDRGGAAAYLLWPSGAKKLVAFTEGLSPLADAALNLAPNVRRVQVEPAAAIQAMHLSDFSTRVEGTTVSGGVKARPKYSSRYLFVKGKLVRLKFSLVLFARTLLNFPRAQNRVVTFAGKE
ncbi:glycosyltransferase family 25 protein [Thioclava atlantica]|uniref:glycosyltransferase family 25 protein n=1 Tax=Thioclava atlantica TaxID=1317124 RepID=UPI0009DF1DDE|nr:glycosyltransferase family 25 protein [Thioclava atlantica]